MKIGNKALADFWQEFVIRDWEQRAVLIKDPFETPLALTTEIFAVLAHFREQLFASDGLDSPIFFIDNQQQSDITELLPRYSDGTLAAYAARMEAELGARRFALFWPEFQIHAPSIWQRLREFFLDLYTHIGLPARTADAALFLGNYQLSPQGVHNDATGIFLYQIEGSKTLRVWPRERLPELKTKGLYDFDAFADRAISLAGEQGDLLYWPRGYWHIGENLAGFSVSLSLALWPNQTPAELVLVKAREMLLAHLPESAFTQSYPLAADLLAQAQQLPTGLAATLNALNALTQGPELHEALQENWLNRLTGSGFIRVPPPCAHQPLADHDLIAGDARFPTLYVAHGNDELTCSASGFSFHIRNDAAITEMLARINSGAPAYVGQLLTQYCQDESTRTIARALLEKLLCLRAIKLCADELTPC